MAFRKALTALTALTLFTAPTLAARSDRQTPIMASSNTPPIKIHLEPVSSTPATVKVTISNAHESSPATILRWDLPTENSSRNTGVYHVQPVSPADAAELESPGLQLKRKVPPARTSLLEVPAGDQVTEEFELVSKWIPTDGERYKVWAKGPWRAVWMKKAEEVTDQDLQEITGDFAVDAEWESNVIEVVMGSSAT